MTFNMMFTLLFLFFSLVKPQLSGSVGPLTSYQTKAATKVCDVLDYGASSGSDISTALTDAWAACKDGGLIWIPPGTYALNSWLELDGGSATAIQLDGTIYRNGTAGGNMIAFTSCTDFEFFSGNSKGAIQGYGYKFLENGTYGPRLLRFTDVTDFSFHGIALVDSPSYYTVFDTCSNGEIYNLIVRGITIGETDAIDVWGENIWIHDVEVTNGDECVSVKSPAQNILIESLYCNISGGCSIGSMGLGTNISSISYKYLYMNQADPAFIKTNGGSGTLSGVTWDTVIVKEGSYPLSIDESWGTSNGGEGVQITDLTFKNFYGTGNKLSRPVIRLNCDSNVTCYDIMLENVNLWLSGYSYVEWSCQNAYGTGACLHSGTSYTTYTTLVSSTSVASYSTSSMASDLASAYPSTSSFTIPAIPTSFYPGQQPSSSLLSLSEPGGLATYAKRMMSTPTPTSN